MGTRIPHDRAPREAISPWIGLVVLVWIAACVLVAVVTTH